jgi:hypothetical protein
MGWKTELWSFAIAHTACEDIETYIHRLASKHARETEQELQARHGAVHNRLQVQNAIPGAGRW